MTPAPVDDAPALRSRGSLLAEAAVVGGAALLAVLWVIPLQTSEGGIGLSPAFLPTLCAAACGIFAAADALLRILRAEASPSYPQGWIAFFRIGAVAIAGTVALQWGGAGACALVTVPAGMVAVGERRPLHLAAAAVICGGVSWLVFR